MTAGSVPRYMAWLKFSWEVRKAGKIEGTLLPARVKSSRIAYG